MDQDSNTQHMQHPFLGQILAKDVIIYADPHSAHIQPNSLNQCTLPINAKNVKNGEVSPMTTVISDVRVICFKTWKREGKSNTHSLFLDVEKGGELHQYVTTVESAIKQLLIENPHIIGKQTLSEDALDMMFTSRIRTGEDNNLTMNLEIYSDPKGEPLTPLIVITPNLGKKNDKRVDSITSLPANALVNMVLTWDSFTWNCKPKDGIIKIRSKIACSGVSWKGEFRSFIPEPPTMMDRDKVLEVLE